MAATAVPVAIAAESYRSLMRGSLSSSVYCCLAFAVHRYNILSDGYPASVCRIVSRGLLVYFKGYIMALLTWRINEKSTRSINVINPSNEVIFRCERFHHVHGWLAVS